MQLCVGSSEGSDNGSDCGKPGQYFGNGSEDNQCTVTCGTHVLGRLGCSSCCRNNGIGGGLNRIAPGDCGVAGCALLRETGPLVQVSYTSTLNVAGQRVHRKRYCVWACQGDYYSQPPDQKYAAARTKAFTTIRH